MLLAPRPSVAILLLAACADFPETIGEAPSKGSGPSLGGELPGFDPGVVRDNHDTAGGTEEDTAPEGDTGSGDDTGGAPVVNPLAGVTLWVDPDSNAARQAAEWRADSPEDAALMDKIAEQPVATWLGDWNGDVAADTDEVLTAAAGAVPVFVAYNIPNRDCGGHSSGGADADGYRTWIAEVASGLAGRTAVVVLEPDSIALVDCLSEQEAAERLELLREATGGLRAAGALVYLDAGHSAWVEATEMGERLLEAGVGDADGFALNVSNFRTTDESVGWAERVSAAAGGAHFIVDTGRNGLGPDPGEEWCNPEGRALGEPPGTTTKSDVGDAYLWVKTPGESDGSCNGGPSAGVWWPEYALGLAERAAW